MFNLIYTIKYNLKLKRSLGCVIYECVRLEYLFKGNSFKELALEITKSNSENRPKLEDSPFNELFTK